MTNEAAAALFHSPINQPADALHLLLEASGRTGDLHRQASVNHGLPDVNKSIRDVSGVSGGSKDSDRRKPLQSSEHPHHAMNIDPAIAGEISTGSDDESNHNREILKIWSRLRFVRAGWFTAREAISYID